MNSTFNLSGAKFHWTSAYAHDKFDAIRGLTQIGTVKHKLTRQKANLRLSAT